MRCSEPGMASRLAIIASRVPGRWAWVVRPLWRPHSHSHQAHVGDTVFCAYCSSSSQWISMICQSNCILRSRGASAAFSWRWCCCSTTLRLSAFVHRHFGELRQELLSRGCCSLAPTFLHTVSLGHISHDTHDNAA